MNIIICGVGRVGISIASYLSNHDNNITIIDKNAQLVKRVSDTYDIIGVVGGASQPDVLKRAGAETADIIIAVTDCDEVNMVACQVAHSVFGINRKIARIRNKEYRDPAWSNLFSRNHMPIDVIISPEEEIADAIIQRMSVPGTTNDIQLCDGNIHISGLIVDKDSKLCGEKVRSIYMLNRTYEFRIFSIIRDNKLIKVHDDTIINPSDEIYFICKKDILFDLLLSLKGQLSDFKGNIIICGGGVIGKALCERIRDHGNFSKNNLIVIEQDINTARSIHRENMDSDVLVLNGSALDHEILSEAKVSNSSIFVTVMNNNESNILSSVLAKKMGSQYSIALSNNQLYGQLLPDRLIDAIVNPEVITISRILKNLRQGHIQSIFNIRDSNTEVIEAKVTEECSISNIPLGDLSLHEDITILAIYSYDKNSVVFPSDKTVIKPNDIVILTAQDVKQQDIESLFSFPINLF